MNTRNRFRDFLWASMTAALLIGLQPAAMAADPQKPTQQQLKDREGRLCKKYVREHRGHPDPRKGVEIVKVVYVPCPKPR